MTGKWGKTGTSQLNSSLLSNQNNPQHNHLTLGQHGGTLGEKSTGLTDSKDSRQMFVGVAFH